jgi:hypothetical protein
MSIIKNAVAAFAVSGLLLSTAAFADAPMGAVQYRSDTVQATSGVKPLTQATSAKLKRRTQAVAEYSNGATDVLPFALVGLAGVAGGFALGRTISH